MNNEIHLVPSQEFFNPSKIKENLPEFVGRLKSYLSNDDGKPGNELTGNSPSYRKIQRKVEKANYSDLRHQKIYIPAGLSVPFVEYQEILSDSVEICEKLDEEVVTPFDRWLARGLSDPSKLKSVRKESQVDDFEPHNIDACLIKLGECFKKGDNRVMGKYGEYVERNKDLGKVYDTHDKLIERMIKTDRKLIMGKIENISDNLDTFIKRFEEDPNDYDMSKVSLDLLSKLSYTLAQEVEFYGVIHYHLRSLNTALVDTQDVLK